MSGPNISDPMGGVLMYELVTNFTTAVNEGRRKKAANRNLHSIRLALPLYMVLVGDPRPSLTGKHVQAAALVHF